ncbi:Peroxisomal biogenesis factor 11 (PEX11) [Ceratocystis platani]|uniref:Peroxisomal biogenesis factor 11 (PEX11) n=1 Tax=Ceratocystis fimbriata f. sp. platani TaxID=88771 RepID=A0A0F8BLI2_CERFI|nr:Peroxisomal biogenesis factor 11 (PEX11) [Ceratocystis platani]
MSSTTEKLFALGNDLSGLERLFRGLQALLHLATTTPVIATAVTAIVPQELSPGQLQHAKASLNVTRRFMRLFAFGHAFRAAREAVRPADRTKAADASAGPWRASSQIGSPETLLDALRGSFFCIHGLLESITVLDLAGIPVWSTARDEQLNREAMRMWVAALACSLLATLVRMFALCAYGAVNAVDSFGDMDEHEEEECEKDQEEDEREGAKEKGGGEKVKREKARSKQKPALSPAQRRKQAAAAATAARKSAMHKLQRRVVADALDVLVPASELMWVQVSDTTIGVVMLMTTLLGFVDTWGTY